MQEIIPVLLLVVSCSPDLLYCDEISPRNPVFADMPACRAARHEVLDQPGKPDRVRMAKCRYNDVAYAETAHEAQSVAMY